MEIGKPLPVAQTGLSNQRKRWLPVLQALETLGADMALPVTLDKVADSMSLVSCISNRLNRNGTKFRCNRRGLTVFITRVDDTEGNQ